MSLPRIMFLEVMPQVLLISGCAQLLSGGIWNILPSHMGLLFLKPTLLVGNMEERKTCHVLLRLPTSHLSLLKRH